jgi:hypothetical protein
MRWRSIAYRLVAVATSPGCVPAPRHDAPTAGESPPAATSQDAAVGSSPAIRVDGGTTLEDLSELDRELIDDDLHARGREHLYGTRKQVPPPKWKPLRGDDPFPFDRVVTVRGYSFDLGGFAEIAFLTGSGLLREDGTFGLAASFPGALLSPAQQSTLLGLIRTHGAEKLHALSRCTFDPNHGFVFFDKDGTPIAKLEVSLPCHEWATTPGPLRGEMYDTTPIRALCRELRLGGCWSGDERVTSRFAELGARRLLVPAETADEVFADLGFDPARRLDGVTTAEKRLLCRWGQDRGADWYGRSWADPMSSDNSFGLVFPGPPEVQYVFQDTRVCVATFPRCGSALAEVARCYVARFRPRRDDSWQRAPTIPADCEAVRGCFWGFEERVVQATDAGARDH